MKNVKIIYILLVILNILPAIIIAQEKIFITGQIKDSKNKLPFCDVVLLTADSTNRILAFGLTNSKGEYQIEWKADNTKSLQLEAIFMGYDKGIKKFSLEPEKQTYTINLELKPRSQELKEVRVVAEQPTVRIREDTTYFNLAKIRDSTEVVVEDLIRKLPGMTVTEDGSIKFKGKKIRKVLLDGDDLFGENYKMGTKNIQADHVIGISAIENYTDNPLLKGVEITEAIAINLEFRPGLSLAHNLKAGVGPDKQHSFTHKAIAITKKIKAFTLLDQNTLGNKGGQGIFDASTYITGLNLDASSRNSSFLGMSMSATQAERNNSWFGSINLLPHLTETFIARLNLDFFSDKAESEHYSKQIITTDPNNPIIIEQSNKQIDKPRFFNAKLYLEKYLSENSRINNTTTFSRKRNLSNNDGLNNNVTQHMDKSINDHFFNSDFEFSTRLKNGSSVLIGFDISSNETTEELLLTPSIDLETNSLAENQLTSQDIKSKKQGLNVNGMFMLSLFKKHKVNVGLSNTIYKSSLTTLLSGVNQQGGYSNDIDYKILIPAVDFSYEYKYKKLRISPSLGLKLYSYDYQNAISLLNKKETNLLTNASIKVLYEFIHNHIFSMSYNNSQKAPNDNTIYDNYILVSNRLLKKNEINFDAQKSQQASIGYRYQSLLSGFDYSIGANYNKNNSKYQTDYIFENDLSYQTTYLSDLGSSNYGINAGISCRLRKIIDRFSIGYRFNNNEYYNSVNSDLVSQSESVRHNYNLSFKSKVFWNMYFENSVSLSRSTYYTEGIKQNLNESFSNKFSMFMNVFKSIHIKAWYNYIVPSTDNFDNANHTLNMSVYFTNKKKNLIFTLDGRNLMNQKVINNVQTNDYSQMISYSNLQKRFFLYSVQLRF